MKIYLQNLCQATHLTRNFAIQINNRRFKNFISVHFIDTLEKSLEIWTAKIKSKPKATQRNSICKSKLYRQRTKALICRRKNIALKISTKFWEPLRQITGGCVKLNRSKYNEPPKILSPVNATFPSTVHVYWMQFHVAKFKCRFKFYFRVLFNKTAHFATILKTSGDENYRVNSFS